jgi:acetamidase/formamidase
MPTLPHFARFRRTSVLAVLLCFGPILVSAMEIAADYHVPFTPENAILGYFSATKKPVLVIPSGAIVRIDGGGGIRYNRGAPPTAAVGTPAPATPAAPAGPGATPSDETVDAWLVENHIPVTVATCPALAETLEVMRKAYRPKEVAGGHLLNGPIYVEGAEPGDTLEVRILDVTPRIPYGTVGGSPGGGALPDVTPRPFTHVVHLDLKRNAGVFDDQVEVPLAPFMGVMATCPADSEGPYRRSGPPGAFGGNLDCKYLCAGSTLYLPIFQKGALFYTGDSHAAQGDGEVTVNAIETADTCTLQFILHKGETLKMPRAENATHYLTFGLDPDLNKAMHQAILETIDFLKKKQGYDFFQAYALTSIAVDFHVTQDVDKTNGIHGMIPKKLFIHDTNTYWYRPN